jgi:cadmium resistance protein CadD (predicted permease)
MGNFAQPIKMKKLTVMEFESLCSNLGIKTFIFNSDNQNERQDPYTYVNMAFSSVEIMTFPACITFAKGKDYISLYNVKYIFFPKTATPIGHAVTIVCGAGTEKNEEISYKFVCR